MKTLKVRVPLTPSYKSNYAVLQMTEVELDIELENGAHTVKTNMKEVGNVEGSNAALMAGLTLWYRFDETTNVLTLCGNDIVSIDSMYVTTVPAGSTEACHQHTYDNDDNACGINTGWNYCQNDPALKRALQATVRQANDMIIAEAKNNFTVIVLEPIPDLPDDFLDNLKAVYRNGKFLELYDDDKGYTRNDAVFTIKSVFKGLITLTDGQYFANVIGSSTDPKIDGDSWIQLWNHYYSKSQGGDASICSSYKFDGFDCGDMIVGGHVILGKKCEDVPYGVDYVFIIPICQRHNKNNNVYMSPIKYKVGVALKNYHN